jgi:hypothetical protein
LLDNKCDKTLKDLLSHQAFITSVDALQAVVGRKLIHNFDTNISEDGKKSVLLPKNAKELMTSSYLFAVYVKCLELHNYVTSISEVNTKLELKIEGANLTYLKSFCIPIITLDMPKLPHGKSNIQKGLMSAAYIILSNVTGVDVTIMKIRTAAKPSLELFGDVWGKAHPTEKRMLDFLIFTLKEIDFSDCDFSSYMLDINSIEKEKGTQVNSDGVLLSNFEREVINHYTKTTLKVKFEMPPIDTVKSPKDMAELHVKITERQAVVKVIKNAIKDIESERVKACFALYKGAKREKVKSTPVMELKDKIKGTEHYRAFNPSFICKILGMNGIAPLQVKDEKSEKAYETQLEIFVSDLAKKASQPISLNFRTEYKEFSALCFE